MNKGNIAIIVIVALVVIARVFSMQEAWRKRPRAPRKPTDPNRK